MVCLLCDGAFLSFSPRTFNLTKGQRHGDAVDVKSLSISHCCGAWVEKRNDWKAMTAQSTSLRAFPSAFFSERKPFSGDDSYSKRGSESLTCLHSSWDGIHKFCNFIMRTFRLISSDRRNEAKKSCLCKAHEWNSTPTHIKFLILSQQSRCLSLSLSRLVG